MQLHYFAWATTWYWICRITK